MSKHLLWHAWRLLTIFAFMSDTVCVCVYVSVCVCACIVQVFGFHLYCWNKAELWRRFDPFTAGWTEHPPTTLPSPPRKTLECCIFCMRMLWKDPEWLGEKKKKKKKVYRTLVQQASPWQHNSLWLKEPKASMQTQFHRLRDPLISV